MKKNFNLSFLGISLLSLMVITGCSDNDPNDDKPSGEQISTTISFEKVPMFLIPSNSYGPDLYYGAVNQIIGYMTQISGDKYAQFPVNYGQTWDLEYNPVWGYSFLLGGMAVSKYHDMKIGTYENQLSVYDKSSPSGGNFIVTYGDAHDENFKTFPNPGEAVYSDYSGCGRVFITDIEGYTVKDPGVANSKMTGKKEYGYFKSVYLNNTTYVFDVIKNGNAFTGSKPLENQEGWLKVQFIAFDSTEDSAVPAGYTEAYLANYNSKMAEDYIGIIEEWIKVDLSSLPMATVLVINFVGSDNGTYGLNTPAYCALDKFEISVNKD